MERFFNVKTNKPVDEIEVAQGETRILGLPKYNLNDVEVRSEDTRVAFALKVVGLKDKSKKSYNDHYNIHEVLQETTPMELNHSVFFQICGYKSGTTELTARFTNRSGSAAYARSVTVKVKENKKLLTLLPTASFNVLWENHPLNPKNRSLYPDPEHPCQKSAGWLSGQCMVRFCAALEKTGVSLNAIPGGNTCKQSGKEHKNHYINPYDFESWKGLKEAYSWEANPPYRPEPMPGLAAYYFTLQKRGIILFWKYWTTDKKKGDMFGGHIDLWNRDRMGNTFSYSDPTTGLAAFARAQKIVFWPLEPV